MRRGQQPVSDQRDRSAISTAATRVQIGAVSGDIAGVAGDLDIAAGIGFAVGTQCSVQGNAAGGARYGDRAAVVSAFHTDRLHRDVDLRADGHTAAVVTAAACEEVLRNQRLTLAADEVGLVLLAALGRDLDRLVLVG